MNSATVLVSSGYSDGPAQALVRWLEEERRDVVLITHPLVPELNLGHQILEVRDGSRTRRVWRRPHRPPLSYLFDLLTPLIPPRSSTWVGFNCLASLQGLLMRRLRRATRVIHWNVDFVEERFGNQTLNAFYKWLDRKCWEKSDVHVELTSAALEARSRKYGMSISSKDVIVPMGAWTSNSPKVRDTNFEFSQIVFVGHLVERMGLDKVIYALPQVISKVSSARLLVIGDGPEKQRLEEIVAKIGIQEHVNFCGFIQSSEEVNRLLASSTLAVAPYRRESSNFSHFADPGKLKMYTGVGLPTLTTDVAPFAKLMFKAGAALEISDEIESIERCCLEVLCDRRLWLAMTNNATKVGEEFDWSEIFKKSALFN